MLLHNNTFKNNTSSSGSGIYAKDIKKLVIEDSVFIENKAINFGGGIFIE